ncbi:MAG: hypothetical protein II809_04230 [Bacteroidales bacterium]|jgi:hypothetical protein|nr:hypothetical protein [Bacteroidales bacterium]MBQ6556599.1 hypothetical protein [Bacteroidales bacterium]MBQ6821881.1 hypothetical protein [Bacteroidales bacterium]MBR0030062.1 hypothetical protein [Bacteroidales bacterium]MBR0083038.1 hypothetical protein [Bacteroidales bacterium]
MKKIIFAMMALLLTAGAFAQETECISKEMDGSLTVRVWGTGRNRTDALEQAKKQAVYDVLFKGITRGNTDYNMRPIMTEVNARQRYQDYFDIFFMDRGEYRKYISMEDKRAGSTRTRRNYRDVTVGTTVRVLVPQLRARLKEDGLL